MLSVRLEKCVRAVLFALCVVASIGGVPARAEDPPFLSDLRTSFPEAYSKWIGSLPYAINPMPWLIQFHGVASPLRDVTIGGQHVKFGTVCVPRDCGRNIAGVAFTPDQSRIFAVIRLSSLSGVKTLMAVGQMNEHESSCVDKLIDAYQLTAC
jgi:hypothetical protein